MFFTDMILLGVVQGILGSDARARSRHSTLYRAARDAWVRSRVYIPSMMLRRHSLDEALAELERGLLSGTTRIAVSRAWWDRLAHGAQTTYQSRCAGVRVSLAADDHISGHFVEVSGASDEDPPLSSEHPI